LKSYLYNVKGKDSLFVFSWILKHNLGRYKFFLFIREPFGIWIASFNLIRIGVILLAVIQSILNIEIFQMIEVSVPQQEVII
jgi:hypothetical protein